MCEARPTPIRSIRHASKVPGDPGPQPGRDAASSGSIGSAGRLSDGWLDDVVAVSRERFEELVAEALDG
ncbi:MAG TPA: hypothetical protein VFN80_04180, partial [Acidothermaceae bacterium]|nr:hypothetical protein [Acidothermaceae bacterium]